MRQRAKNCTMMYALGASGACGFFKLIIPIPFIEVGALTLVTKKMCKEITNIYGYSSIEGLGTLFGVAIGAFSGAKLATGFLDFFPGIGAGANAIATFSLHTLTGYSLILICELLKDGKITEKDIKNSPISIIDIIAKISITAVGGFLRGDLNDAILSGKRAFKWSKVHTDIPLVQQTINSDIHIVAKKALTVGANTIYDTIQIVSEKSNTDDNCIYNEFISNSQIDAIEYYEKVNSIYRDSFLIISSSSTIQTILNESGKIYESIFNLNIKNGIWKFKTEFDHFLVYVIAGQIKDKIANQYLDSLRQKELAQRITVNIFKWLDGENEN
jgi:uncharacterized protein (DUF697 family)